MNFSAVIVGCIEREKEINNVSRGNVGISTSCKENIVKTEFPRGQQAQDLFVFP